MAQDRRIPQSARVIVIGGGIIGCSVAYHLAQMGCTEVLLLERDRLTSGTTWHAAGLMVSFGSLSQTSTEMRTYSRELYARLEEETGQATGFRPIGFIEAASDPDRLEEYRRVAAFNRFCGVDVHEISAREIAELFPIAHTDDLLAGFYVKEDGRVNPVDVTMALAKGARMRGVQILEGLPVTGLQRKGKRVAGVLTAEGAIESEVVVNCAGMWARELGASAGVSIPLQAAEHYYLITEAIAGMDSSWPVLEVPGSHGYFREEVGGLMVGLFEPVCAPWKLEGIPEDFSFGKIAPDWDRMAPYLETAMKRVPISMEVGVKTLFCGPESFTPDLQPVVGEAPELRNYFVAAGLNSVGILTGGGLGRVLAHWILNGSADVDVTAFHIDRLQPFQCSPSYRAERSLESLGMVYQCHYPNRQMQTARGVKTSALHDRLVARGAYFREISGWESPDWYAPEGVEPRVDRLSWGRESWFPYWAEEHRAAREEVVVMDMSFMAKFRVSGPDAGALLEYLSANRVAADCERTTYTQWLNAGGTVEADLTVSKLSEESFLVVASDSAHRHVLSWMRRHAENRALHIEDLTGAYALLSIQGPRSRDLLQSLSTADLSDEAFPFRRVAPIDIGFAEPLCMRISYVGELGYELYVPVEQVLGVYDRLLAGGRAFALRHAGLKALNSLRLEMAYRDYGHDLDNTDTPFEAGLAFAVDLKSPGDFLGRAALLRRKQEWNARRRMVQVLVLEPEALMFGGEILLRNDVAVGYLRSASYGHTLGGAIGLAMIDAEETIDRAYLESGIWTVEIAGRRYSARVSLRSLLPPPGMRGV